MFVFLTNEDDYVVYEDSRIYRVSQNELLSIVEQRFNANDISVYVGEQEITGDIIQTLKSHKKYKCHFFGLEGAGIFGIGVYYSRGSFIISVKSYNLKDNNISFGNINLCGKILCIDNEFYTYNISDNNISDLFGWFCQFQYFDDSLYIVFHDGVFTYRHSLSNPDEGSSISSNSSRQWHPCFSILRRLSAEEKRSFLLRG